MNRDIDISTKEGVDEYFSQNDEKAYNLESVAYLQSLHPEKSMEDMKEILVNIFRIPRKSPTSIYRILQIRKFKETYLPEDAIPILKGGRRRRKCFHTPRKTHKNRKTKKNKKRKTRKNKSCKTKRNN